jgi:hypothetical protein
MRRALTWILLGSLAALVCLSIHLAATRIYQVDECTEVVVANILASGHAKTYTGNFGLLHFPLAWAAHGATRAADLYVSGRFVMVTIFWLNLVLIAMATGERLLSRSGLIALVGAATLAPMWDFGFEIRHDNLLLSGLLLTWVMVRISPRGLLSYFIAGGLLVAMQFAAHKAFVYTIPLFVAALVFPPPGHVVRRWKLAIASAIGVIAMLLLLRLLYGACGATGLLQGRQQGLQFVSGVAASQDHFGPGMALKRLLYETPLLLALVVSALVALGIELRRQGRNALTWSGSLPEALLFLGALGALLANPTPFPYNLLNLVPFAFLFAFRHASGLWKATRDSSVLLAMSVGVLIVVHFAPFGIFTSRNFDRPNSRQACLMTLAEDLTDSVKDPVFDGIGMVPTRSSDPRALLHSLSFRSLITGPGPQIRDMLAERPAVVVIPNYRTDWLPEEDHAFIRRRYVPLADDFWVLGNVLPAGGGAFEVVHAGRYRVSSLQDSELSIRCLNGSAPSPAPLPSHAQFAGTLDGVPVSNQPVELAVGTHQFEGPADSQAAVVWVGPWRDRVGCLAPRDHRYLFLKWE